MLDPIILVYFYVYLIGYIFAHIMTFNSMKTRVLNYAVEFKNIEESDIKELLESLEPNWLNFAHTAGLTSWIGVMANLMVRLIHKLE